MYITHLLLLAGMLLEKQLLLSYLTVATLSWEISA